MKLAKLSLAAIVAVGAMTTIASAQPLEEAIKGVEFSGFMEYTLNNQQNEGNAATTTTNDWDFLGKLTSPVADNLKATVVFASGNSSETTADGGSLNVDENLKADGSRNAMNFDIRKAFFTYSKDAVTVMGGLQDLKTPVTNNGFNGQKGNGVVGMYNAGPVTAAAAYFGNSNVATAEDDIFAAGLMGSMDMFSARAWYVKVPNAIKSLYFLEGSVATMGASLTAQYVSSKEDAANAETGKFYAVKGAYAYENFGISAVYTKNDDEARDYALANVADTEVIGAGWRLVNTNGNRFEKTMGFEGTAKFNEYGFIAGYAKADEFDSATVNTVHDIEEMYAGVSYNYSKNFSTYVRYSDVDSDVVGEDFQYLRFNAKYSF